MFIKVSREDLNTGGLDLLDRLYPCLSQVCCKYGFTGYMMQDEDLELYFDNSYDLRSYQNEEIQYDYSYPDW